MIEGLKHTEVTGIHLAARPGGILGNCIHEALKVATQEWQNVMLIHNGKQYQILCNDLIGCAKEMK